MKTKLTLFRRNGIYYSQDSITGKQKSLGTRDETTARKMVEATNEAHRTPILNLQLARAYLSASDPAFLLRTWQTVMDQMQTRGRDSSRTRYVSAFRNAGFDRLILIATSPDAINACTSAMKNTTGVGIPQVELLTWLDIS